MSGGGVLGVERFDGEHGEGRCDRPFPPGSRLQGTCAGTTVRLKVSGCARADAAFRVKFRFVDLSRDLRLKILAGTTQPPEGSSR